MDKIGQKIHGNRALLLLFYIHVDNSVRGSLKMLLVFIVSIGHDLKLSMMFIDLHNEHIELCPLCLLVPITVH